MSQNRAKLNWYTGYTSESVTVLIIFGFKFVQFYKFVQFAVAFVYKFIILLCYPKIISRFTFVNKADNQILIR